MGSQSTSDLQSLVRRSGVRGTKLASGGLGIIHTKGQKGVHVRQEQQRTVRATKMQNLIIRWLHSCTARPTRPISAMSP